MNSPPHPLTPPHTPTPFPGILGLNLKSVGEMWKVELNSSNYATKSDLGSLELRITKLDISESENTPVGLSKLSNVVKDEIV